MFIDKPEKKDTLMTYKVTKTQKQIIIQMAKERGMPVSEMLMYLLEQEYSRPTLVKNSDGKIFEQDSFWDLD